MYRYTVVLCLMALILASCGGGGDGEHSEPASPPVQDTPTGLNEALSNSARLDQEQVRLLNIAPTVLDTVRRQTDIIALCPPGGSIHMQ